MSKSMQYKAGLLMLASAVMAISIVVAIKQAAEYVLHHGLKTVVEDVWDGDTHNSKEQL